MAATPASLGSPAGFSVPRITREIISGLGLITPQSYEQYIENYPGIVNDTYVMTAESLPGVLRFSPNKEYWRYEDNNKPLPAVQVVAAATGTPTAGQAAEYTLTAGSHQKNKSGAGAYSPVAVGQTWVDDKDNMAYEVTLVVKSTAGAHKVTFSPLDISKTVAIDPTSLLKYYGRDSVKEGAGQDDGIYKTLTKVQRDLSAIRVNKSYTDLAMFERLDIPGEVTFYTMNDGDMEKEFKMIQELRLVFGQKYSNTKHSNNQNTDSLGLIPQIQGAGSVYAPPTANTIDKAYFKGLTRQNDADGYTNEYHGLLDTEFQMAFEDYLDTYNQNGGIQYASFGGSKEVAISRNFSSHSIYGTTYHTKKYAYFNSARTHGAQPNTGFWNNTALWIPQGEVLFEGNKFRNFNIHYMAEHEGGKINHFLQSGGLLSPTSSTDMVANLALEAWKGINAYNLQSYKLTQL